jgi:fibronectin type 3 domain-containing protein
VPVGATACYVVRAVASVQPLVESAPSNEACVEVRDVTPPATPAGLAVLPREGGLEVLWSPSAEADLAGYRVYRAAPGGEPKRVAEVPAARASWLDESAQHGVTYRYAVTAFDQSQNESERTEPVEATLP